jgi:hypothetical protein
MFLVAGQEEIGGIKADCGRARRPLRLDAHQSSGMIFSHFVFPRWGSLHVMVHIPFLRF